MVDKDGAEVLFALLEAREEVYADRRPRGLSAPWTFDPPRIPACVVTGVEQHAAAVRLDAAGDIVLDLDGARRPLLGDPEIVPSHTWLERDDHGDPFSRDVHLLVDRRVPAPALVPFLGKLSGEADRVLVVGAVIQTLPTADGPLETWMLCTFAELDRDAVTTRIPAGTTWDDIVDDPALRWLKRLPAPAKRP